jgi:hypothetical protein
MWNSIHHSSFIIHHSSFIIHHSSFIIHHSSFPPPPAYGLGDGAKPPETRQHLPVAALHQLWQDGAGMNESEKQFSFTRATSSTSGRAKNQIQFGPSPGPNIPACQPQVCFPGHFQGPVHEVFHGMADPYRSSEAEAVECVF